MRLAWFSPWPPDRSGIASRSAELVEQLADRRYGIDLFVDERRVPAARAAAEPPSPGEIRVQSAHDFVWRTARAQYDLAVYQVGNSRLHEFIWPYLFRWPGLVALHDARLHHARGRALLSRGGAEAYRVEFAWNHPDVSADAAELAIAGFDGAYFYQWPMIRSVVHSSRLVAVHSRAAVAELEADHPERPLEYVALGEGRRVPPSERDRRARRAALGVPDHAVVFGVFGSLTAAKRLAQVMRAFATTLLRTPDARLLLAGAPDPTADVAAIARELNIAEATLILPPPDAEAFDELIAAADVTLNLRWPSALEVSGPWLRALAVERPTVIIDLAHLAHAPTLDPRTWRLHGPRPDHQSAPDAVAVAIDILDEEHSLRLAMHRLATDAPLRAQLGRAARRYWEAEHTVDRMVDDYERVLARATREPDPASAVPIHLRPDPLRHSRELVAPFGVTRVLEE